MSKLIYYASRRSHTRNTVKLTVHVCVCVFQLQLLNGCNAQKTNSFYIALRAYKKREGMQQLASKTKGGRWKSNIKLDFFVQCIVYPVCGFGFCSRVGFIFSCMPSLFLYALDSMHLVLASLLKKGDLCNEVRVHKAALAVYMLQLCSFSDSCS